MRLFQKHSPLPLDADAFAALYQAHLAAVFNYCWFRVGDRALAEDLTADVFERAWRARHSYRPERAGFSTWLIAIAHNAVTDWQRRSDRRPTRTLPDDIPDAAPLPDRLFETAEDQARLRTLLQALAPDEQELIALKFGAGTTNRQIAALLGRSESAIGVAVHRLMRKLRAAWEPKDETLER